MSPNADDEFADRLAAIDEALAAGVTDVPVDESEPPELHERLIEGRKAIEALQRLRLHHHDS